MSIRIAIGDDYLDSVSRQKDRPYTRALLTFVLLDPDVLRLVPVARRFTVLLLVRQPSHCQLQIRLPFQRIADAALFTCLGRATAILNRHHISPSATDPTRPLDTEPM